MSYDLAVDWLLDKRRKGLNVPDNITATQLRAFLEDTVLESSPETMNSWSDRFHAPNLLALRAAAKVVERQNLYKIASSSNYDSGIALPSQAVLSAVNRTFATSATRGFVLPPLRLTRSRKPAQKMWLTRWRKRHHVRFGRVRFGEPCTLEEKRHKVIDFWC